MRRRWVGLALERQWYGSNGREKVEVLLHETNDCRLVLQSESGTQNEREGGNRSVCRSRRAEVSVMVDVVRVLGPQARGAKDGGRALSCLRLTDQGVEAEGAQSNQLPSTVVVRYRHSDARRKRGLSVQGPGSGCMSCRLRCWVEGGRGGGSRRQGKVGKRMGR